MTVKEAIAHVVARRDISEVDMSTVMMEIMDGQATPAQIGALLTALHIKGETVAEITGAARVMRELAIRVHPDEAVLDTCGTGGDGRLTFNISTAAAFVAAAAGLCVAKHGNRAMSGAVGGADVLETLGAKVELSPAQVERCLREVKFGFLFAPAFHRAMRYAVGPRREIGIRTIFNLLGPLTNPAGARHQLMGVFDKQWAVPVAEALGKLGSSHALVVHGEDGLDEISLTAPTFVAEWHAGTVRTMTIAPQDFGLSRCTLAELQVKSAQESAAIIRAVFADTPGPRRDIVILNAGAALYAGDAVPSLVVGVERARAVIASGAAMRTLERFIALTHEEMTA
ncbi:MAG: anthranilate phosphoribosyltransferase [Deltaproteobacteria bacterium]|nr:anthranilate phosphoribosyltransferase [Deltaproteobacteria bacterium]